MVKQLLKNVFKGCGDGRGNCVKVGDRLKGTCYEAVCSMNENKTQVSLDVIKGGKCISNMFVIVCDILIYYSCWLVQFSVLNPINPVFTNICMQFVSVLYYTVDRVFM